MPWEYGVIPGEMCGRQLRERDPKEGYGPGVWGRAGSGGAGQARLQAECVGAGRERGPRGLTGPSGRGGEGNWAER